ncbi:MAG: class II aldolase/adducin family protein [Burkholderiaceae bacterium]|nr:class II aldolase/adducin family protein [Burkholderiaceae bacterium]
MDEDLAAQLSKLATASRILELEGHGDMSLGHISLRDPAGRGFWMKRNRIGLGEVLGPDDFILLDFEGHQMAGEGGRHSEWPIHSQILRRRDDIQVVAHTHAFYTSVLSAADGPLLPFTLDGDYFTEVARHEDAVALIRTREEGDALAAALGEAFAVLMANHGVTFCGTSIEHATCVGVFLEKAARAHVIGLGAGLRHTLPAEATRRERHRQIMSAVHVEHSWDFFCRKLAWFGARAGGGGAVFAA